MKLIHLVVTYRQLRDTPIWRLLAADRGPTIIAMLNELLATTDKALPASVMQERLTRELDQVRQLGEGFPNSAQAYLTEWLAYGWLTRRLPPGGSEEIFELTTDAANAIRFVTGILRPRTSATESRLAAVIAQLSRLAEETDPNPQSRIASLKAERDRIDREIERVERGGAQPLAMDRALERAREIIALADELTNDFRSVREEFDKLNRSLRQSLLETESSRGKVLEDLFQGIDVIAESDPGRTFNAFWRLLTDAEQSALLMDSVNGIASRPFAKSLDSRERRFLLGLTSTLMTEGGRVHDVLQSFARSLKNFVQSREFLEQRRLNSLLSTARQAAMEALEHVRPNQAIGFDLTLTSSQVRSVSQWLLHDPELSAVRPEMEDAAPAVIDLETVSELLRNSEIDLRSLRMHLGQFLSTHSQATIAEVLAAYPAEQGLGSVVGYIALGAKFGEVTPNTELVTWESADGAIRRARIPVIYFMGDSLVEPAY